MSRKHLFAVLLLPLILAGPAFAGSDGLNAVVVSQEALITSEDIEQISLSFSRINNVILVKIKFNDAGHHKLKGLLKGNLNKKLALSIDNEVALMPVHIATEEAFNPLTISVADDSTALKLLKKLTP
jgi:preprotein translocase subunit SecD